MIYYGFIILGHLKHFRGHLAYTGSLPWITYFGSKLKNDLPRKTVSDTYFENYNIVFDVILCTNRCRYSSVLALE